MGAFHLSELAGRFIARPVDKEPLKQGVSLTTNAIDNAGINFDLHIILNGEAHSTYTSPT